MWHGNIFSFILIMKRYQSTIKRIISQRKFWIYLLKFQNPNYENNSNENSRLYCFTSVVLTFLNLIWYSFRRYSLEAQMGVIKNFKTKLALYQYLSVYCPNAGKYGTEKLRIRTLFLQCQPDFKLLKQPLTYLGL